MNPFSLTGPQFLLFYAALVFATLFVLAGSGGARKAETPAASLSRTLT